MTRKSAAHRVSRPAASQTEPQAAPAPTHVWMRSSDGTYAVVSPDGDIIAERLTKDEAEALVVSIERDTLRQSKVRNIALGLLVLSPTNVRKTPPTAAEDAELEASIRAKGILQNLIVHSAPIGGKDIYEVDAGGRRLKVLQKLAAEGVIQDYHPVPCLVREPGLRRNLLDGKHGTRRDASGRRICRHGGDDRRGCRN